MYKVLLLLCFLPIVTIFAYPYFQEDGYPRSFTYNSVHAQEDLSGKGILAKLLRRGSETRTTLEEAWKASFLSNNRIQERGGYIFADPDQNLNVLKIAMAPDSASESYGPDSKVNLAIDLNRPPQVRRSHKMYGWILVANFHTHPIKTSSLAMEPSGADISNAMYRGVPGIVISSGGIYTYGPSQRSNLSPPEQDKGRYPNDGPDDFNKNVRSSVKREQSNPFD